MMFFVERIHIMNMNEALKISIHVLFAHDVYVLRIFYNGKSTTDAFWLSYHALYRRNSYQDLLKFTVFCILNRCIIRKVGKEKRCR